MGEIDSAGELVTGALLGRAIEPRAGDQRQPTAADAQGTTDSPDAPDAPALCLNCGTALIGSHCHRCGQAGHVHRTIGAIFHEILHGVVHFEGKLWHTLPLLAWRPGELTRRYIAGERARFVSPMALFLFSVFTMFAAFSLAGITPPSDIPATAGQFGSAVDQARAGLVRERADVRRELGRFAADDPAAAPLRKRLAEADEGLAALDQMRNVTLPDNRAVNLPKTGWDTLDKGIQKANQNPGLLLYKLQANSYKFSWALIPLSLPFVWLMFAWKREYHGYDHAIFVTYSIAFMSMLFIALTLFAALGMPDDWIVAASFIIPPLHIYRQLRGAYRLRRTTAILRTIVLLVLITCVIAPAFLVILLLLGLLG